jgi:hypothetical protein
MATDRKAASEGGYTPEFLAFKHGISLGDASNLINHIGQDRRELDKAAVALKKTARRPRE